MARSTAYFFLTLATSTVVLMGCASNQYQPPAPGEASATLAIMFGKEGGDLEFSHGKKDGEECFSFSRIYELSGRFRDRSKQLVQEVPISVGELQVFRYSRYERNAFCHINIEFLPQQGIQYLVRSGTRYYERDDGFLGFLNMINKEQCTVELFRKDEDDVLTPVEFKRLPIEATRMFFGQCPKVLTKRRSFLKVGSQSKFDMDTSGMMRPYP